MVNHSCPFPAGLRLAYGNAQPHVTNAQPTMTTFTGTDIVDVSRTLRTGQPDYNFAAKTALVPAICMSRIRLIPTCAFARTHRGVASHVCVVVVVVVNVHRASPSLRRLWYATVCERASHIIIAHTAY